MACRTPCQPAAQARKTALGWLTAGMLLLAVPAASAEDVVWLSSERGAAGGTRLVGTVVDFTGEQLVIEMASGQMRTFPGDRVQRIESSRTAEEQAADGLLAGGDPKGALEQYRTAMRLEERNWVKRRIAAGTIDCYRRLGAWERAGDLFLALLREDPLTPYFSVLPLPWLAADPNPALTAKAQAWIAASQSATARLLGASHLLGGPQRQQALDELERLSGEADPQRAGLARGQIWRGTYAAAPPDLPIQWLGQIESMPAAVRAGPYLVVGKALAHREFHALAVQALMRPPIHFSQEAHVAGESLWLAGQSFGALGQVADAREVFRELAAHYPDSRRAAEAVAQLDGETVEPSVASAGEVAAPDAWDAAFLDGLRERRLLQTAAAFCRAKLEDTTLLPEQRTEIGLELAETLVQQALAARPEARASVWDATDQLCKELLAAAADDSRRLLILTQSGLAALARGELARLESEVAAQTEESREATRSALRQAIGELEAADGQLAEVLRRVQTRRPRPGDEALSADDLIRLQRNLRYQLARGLRNQGQTYPPASPDRTNALLRAVELLHPLAETDADEAWSWGSRLDEAVCYRLLEDRETAEVRLGKIESLSPPPRVTLSIRAERIRLALASDELEAALDWVDQDSTLEGQSSADLDYARLEAVLAAGNAADADGRAQESRDLQGRAAAFVRQIDARHGDYWRRRAETLLAEHVVGGAGAQDVNLLLRAADSLYKSGQPEESLATYDKARDLAKGASDMPAAFRAAFTAAAIEESLGRHAAAARRFLEAARESPQHPQASEAHLLAAYHTAQVAQEDQTGEDEFASLMNEHLERWPDAPTANQAQLWLGRLHRRHGRFREATVALAAVDPAHAAYAEAIGALPGVYRAWLTQTQQAGTSVADLAAQTADALESVLLGAGADPAAAWSDAKRQASLDTARLLLEFTPSRADQAARILAAALDSSADAPPEWRQAANGMQVQLLARSGDRPRAAAVLAELPADATLPLYEIAVSLEAAARENGAIDAVSRALAELAWSAAERLEGNDASLSPDQRSAVRLAAGRALTLMGRGGDALPRLESLAREAPQSGEVQEALAEVLSLNPQPESQKQALAKWTEIYRKSRAGGDRWFRSNYGQAAALIKLDRTEEAKRLVASTRKLHPDLGGAELRAKFDVLGL